MKAKNWLLLSGLALSGLVWNGCYTQIARPDREEDTQVAEATDEESGGAQRDQESDDRYTDDRHVTNVYEYDDYWWGWRRPYWGYSSAYWNRYQRSRFYVSVGFGYYDPYNPWGWCGTPWSWCDPWDSYYGPYSGWHPSYYYDPFYYPRHVVRDRVADQRKRTTTRRGSTPADDNSGSAGTYAGGGSRGSLARPVSGTYARGDDGSYRRVRRTDATKRTPGSTTEATNVIDRDNGNSDDTGRRTVRRTTNDGGDKTVARRPSSDGNSSRGSERRGKHEPTSNGGERRGSGGSSGGSVSRPSGSSGQSSPPPKSGGSSGNTGSSERRRRN